MNRRPFDLAKLDFEGIRLRKRKKLLLFFVVTGWCSDVDYNKNAKSSCTVWRCTYELRSIPE